MNEYISEAIQYMRIIGRSVLADEVSDLHKAAATLAVEKAEQAAAIRALQARVMALEKDAGRYRYIRDNAKEGAVKTLLPLYRAHYFVSLEPISECPTFDEAIDAAIRALQARCEAAEKDAERYRWVREYDNGSGVSCGISEEVADKGWERVGWLYEDELDAAIDAAIRPTESGKGE